jgi:carboxyl-terminal processing protease
MKRYAKALLVSVVFVASAFLTYKEKDRFLSSIRAESASLNGAKNSAPQGYKPSNLHVLNSVLLYINQCYVEPDRFDPRKMLLSALEGIEDEVPGIIVRNEEGSDLVEVEVDTAHETFDIKGTNSPWAMSAQLKRIFKFMEESIRDDEVELPDIEYSAINGMLGTLDPHTRLLTPDYYSEMKLDTQGEFGGLGIVISSPEGILTINDVIPDTPATKNGLECGDQIVQIEEESTVNMDVSEAVKLLRGKSGTTVTIWIQREGWKSPRSVEIERAQIHIDSVHSKILPGDVGYVKLSGFQENTYEDLRIHLEKLKKQGMRGLVLDLRDNPGGLLEQSKHIADVFLFAGNIVTTWVPCDRNPKDVSSAHVAGTEPNYPIVALINRGSASASEIVAGALKNHDRAMILGERSFGKGSIQQLKELGDGSALKYTIGQYLTPGDVSIQGIGITPDIQLTPMFVDEEAMDIFAEDETVLRESDLEQSLVSEQAHADQKPVDELEYVYVKPGKKGGKCPPGVDDIIKTDYEVKLAAHVLKDVMTSTKSSSRPKMIQQSAQVLVDERAEQDDRLVKELKKLKIDWERCGEAPQGEPSDLEVTFLQDGKKVQKFRGKAGETVDIGLTIQNRGKGTFCRLYALTRSDSGLMNGREYLMGKLKPGQKRSWTESVKIPRYASSRVDPVEFKFHEERGVAPAKDEIRMQIEELPEPSFAVGWQMLDDIEGNGNGVLERGETGRLRVFLENTGAGKSLSTAVSVQNLSGQGVYIHKGRDEIKDLAPGAEAHADLKIEMLESFDAEAYRLKLSVVDVDRTVRFRDKIELDTAIGAAPAIADVEASYVVVADRAPVLPMADATVAMMGTLAAGTSVTADKRSGGLVRVRLADDGWGWMKLGDLEGKPKVDAKAAPAPALVYASSLPTVEIVGFEPSIGKAGDWTVRQEKLAIKGVASDDDAIKDMYIYLGDDKVFYRSNQGAQDPKTIAFETVLDLSPGVNYVLITVRASPLVVTRKILVIRRDGPGGETLETPKKPLIP